MKNKKEKISELKRTDLNSIKISLSYPMQISACSSGLVKNSETLNYKTLDPENNGLFCSKIFGVSKDYICSCGETKGSKFINIICKICGVETGPSKLRRSRMGHIVFNSFVLNTLFFKATPSYLSIILNISVNNIENILYNDYYLVIYPGEIGLKLNQVLSLNEYLYFSKKYIDKFYADTGIEAIKIALDHIDINYEINLLKKFFILKKNYLSLKYKKNLRRYNIFIYLKKFNITPSRLILENLPILPPDLRPIVKLPSGSLVSSDLNELYKRVINRNNRLKNLISIKAPSVVLFNEKKLLQESIDSLFDNSERVNNISCGSNKQPLKSLSDNIKGKFGLFRQNLLGKRVDYSGRSVIVSGPNLKLNECILPKIIALELFRPFIYNKLISENFNFNIKNAKLEVDKGSDLAIDALLTILKNHPVLLNRAPTLHRLGMQAFNVILSDDKAIKLHPLVCVAFNADFDGDQMAVHIPLSIKAQLEFKQLLISTNNVLHPANGTCCISPTQDIVLGIYYSTRLDINKIGNGMIFNNLYEIRIAYELNLICLNTRIFLRLKNFSTLDTDNFDKKSNFSYTVYETTPGRAFIFNILPKNISYSCINKVFKKNDISNLLIFIYENFGSKSLINFSDNLMSLGFDFATKSGISISIDDMIIHPDKNIIINKSKDLVKMYNLDYYNGLLSQTNRRKKILDI